MKKIGMALLLLVFAVPASGLAIEIPDYVDPDYFYHDAELSVDFRLNSGNQDQTSYNGIAAFEYDMEYSKLQYKIDAHALGRVDISRGPSEDDESIENYNISHDRTYLGGRYYFSDPFGTFGFARMNFGYKKQDSSLDDSEDDPYAHAMVGVGYGRVITATPLMEAYRVIEELKKYGLITADPSDNCYLELSYVIAKRQAYKSEYGVRDYEKFWYQAMEKVLADAGVLKDNLLGVLGTLKVQEILDEERPLYRKHGWEVGAGLGYLISDYSGEEDEDPTANAFFEYTLPIGFDWQIRERLDYSTILVDWEFDDINHLFLNTLSANYEITDKIDWENSWGLGVMLYSGDNTEDVTTNTLETALRFFLSNQLDLRTWLQFNHIDDGVDDDDFIGDADNDDVETVLGVTLTYTIF